ncbi:kinase-like protein [Nadsonia fulvescens var. elongata DSM 6958]|uniref:Kinase-like protein n=1 Tax=Nadsonia fulvescens var. elongata DSM 6958 TaxID=857566 RepID=A0A1E3PFM8_9ASCO|nr:kinase-like protein [Nadsonia fulvescens var. elongata DSM 6958]
MFSGFKSLYTGISSNYSISSTPAFNAGPWTVYNAKKKATKEQVSVFAFDKKKLEKYLSANGVSKMVGTTDLYERLRKDVSSLAKLRHPSILKLIEPLEETKSGFTFVTEKVTSCLKTLMDIDASREKGKLSYHGTDDLSSGNNLDKELDEVVIQKGLLQVANGLQFLHEDAGLVHLDIQPTSIFVNEKGDWKISGLGLVANYDEGSKKEYFIAQYDSRIPKFVQMNLDYSAPELVLDHLLDYGNDLFSLGCVIIALYTYSNPLDTNNNPNNYQQDLPKLLNLKRESTNKLPPYLLDILPRLLSRQVNDRISARGFIDSKYFDNVLIKTIRFLDDYPAKLPAERVKFMKGLANVLGQFPFSILQSKILPTLLEELDKDEDLIGPILNNILAIGKDMSNLGFCGTILPQIKRVEDFNSGQIVLLNNLDIILSHLADVEIKKHVLPIFYKTLSSASPEIQGVALSKIVEMVPHLDFPTIKNEVFPKIGEIFAKTTSLNIKITALYALQGLVTNDGLDKYTVVEKLLPLLRGIKTREPKVMNSALGVFSNLVNILDYDTLAKDVVPQLWSMSIEANLTLDQFNEFMKTIKLASTKIETEHSRKLSSGLLSDSSSSLALNSGEEVNSFKSTPVNSSRIPTPSVSKPIGTDSTDSDSFDSFLSQSPVAPVSQQPQVEKKHVASSLKSAPRSSAVKSHYEQKNNINANSFSSHTVTSPVTSSFGAVQPLPPLQNAAVSSNSVSTLPSFNNTFPLQNPIQSMQISQPLQPFSQPIQSSWAPLIPNNNALSPSPNLNSISSQNGIANINRINSGNNYVNNNINKSNTGDSIDWSSATKPKPISPQLMMNGLNNSINVSALSFGSVGQNGSSLTGLNNSNGGHNSSSVSTPLSWNTSSNTHTTNTSNSNNGLNKYESLI